MTRLTAPYGLNWTKGHTTTADRATGKLYSKHSMIYAGSFQNVAQLGSTFYGPSGTGKIRVEANVTVNAYELSAPAFFGYASAEAIVNLKVMDGSKIVAKDRRSVGRAQSVVFFWSVVKGGPITFTLATEFTGGLGRQYSAHVDVETWIGGGGVTGLMAKCDAKVNHIDVRALPSQIR